jgi:signal transduction histidine kinase
VAIILTLLYLSFFIFFPAQRTNLYFSLSNFFFVAFLLLQITRFEYHGPTFMLSEAEITSGVTYVLLQLYCTYRIFEQKVGFVYFSLFAIAVLGIPVAFLFDAYIYEQALALLIVVEMFRISILSLRKNKTAASIILVGMIFEAIFWLFYLLSSLGIFIIPGIDLYQPFALMIVPLSLAIYLGYAFGVTSQSLRQKLAEVEQLSSEKQEILLAQNETLEKQVNERTAALNQSLHDLKSTQTQLIQSEKMASLGELTAGIAHEIQNPLNFVNNFSEVSIELLEELKDEAGAGNKDDVIAIAGDLIQNLQKINHHGKRADSIVKGMLEHSRIGTGERQPTDINTLIDEFLKLSYHGLRAKDKSFNADISTHFAANLPEVNIVQQDMGRVLLNLFNNAFYAVNQKQKTAGANYKSTVIVTTTLQHQPGGGGVKSILVIVKDNGNGIPAAIKDKIMQPFFTTKPTGEGTGLGLSLSYDIVVKGHGGNIVVNTKEGEGATFTITLPI